MRKLKVYISFFLLGGIIVLSSCEKFFNPELGIVIDESDYFQDWEELSSAELGLYALQQKLVEQIVVLGELRADLLEVTDQADRDLIEINNFEVSSTNTYASPVNFYKLIGACNKLLTKIESEHPTVLDPEIEITNYDRLYGEVLCMRAWAYFNAARIYGKIPYIHPSLQEISEITDYVNSSGTYIDSLFVIYGKDGFHNDTISDTTIILDRKIISLDAVIDTFTNELETDIKAVGVVHNSEFSDVSWDVTIWNNYAKHALLGQMYLYDQDYENAIRHFNPLIYNYDSETDNIKFGLDSKFSFGRWDDILTQIDPYEHIFTIWYNKSNQQTNHLQELFSKEFPNKYMLKPTKQAVQYWEHTWNGMDVLYDDGNPDKTALALNNLGEPKRGTPGDFYRGYGVSYAYYKNGRILGANEVREMLNNKADGYHRLVNNTMEDVDTVVYKYTNGKNSYDHDANFIVFRAASIHLYYAEMLAWRVYLDDGIEKQELLRSLTFVNDGLYNNDARQKGVRGRVGFADGDEALYVRNLVYEHDPATNEVIAYKYVIDLASKQRHLEDIFIEERAREMAFEGERFYDLMRISKRRGDPSFLADHVSAKFSGSKREEIREYLMNEENWHIPLYEIE
ncbi:MAG: RagB/SusD family nutrient uptake outer membrane protein [Bacteroidales bacterium]|nr:RagB/SusD family nutrient uptake outer membrane protein [Bacteroidales bacterium]